VHHLELDSSLVGSSLLGGSLEHLGADVDGYDGLTRREEFEIVACPGGDHERCAMDFAEQPTLVRPESPVFAPGEEVKGATSRIPLALCLYVHRNLAVQSPASTTAPRSARS